MKICYSCISHLERYVVNYGKFHIAILVKSQVGYREMKWKTSQGIDVCAVVFYYFLLTHARCIQMCPCAK